MAVLLSIGVGQQFAVRLKIPFACERLSADKLNAKLYKSPLDLNRFKGTII